jgi:hypothetical protein
MAWPPKIGELLPRADDAYGVHQKLLTYSLDPDHPDGGHKARLFRRHLGITAADIEYLAGAVLGGVQNQPIAGIRDRGEFGMHCRVIVSVHGLREHAERVVNVRTVWEVRWDGDAPRLVTAYITTKLP